MHYNVKCLLNLNMIERVNTEVHTERGGGGGLEM